MIDVAHKIPRLLQTGIETHTAQLANADISKGACNKKFIGCIHTRINSCTALPSVFPILVAVYGHKVCLSSILTHISILRA